MLPSGVRLLSLALAIAMAAGCASSPPRRAARPASGLEGVRRVAVVSSGESRFVVQQEQQESREPSSLLFGALTLVPYGVIIAPLARAVYQGIRVLAASQRDASVAPRDVAPGSVVATAFARALEERGRFEAVQALDREPVAEARRGTDAIVRLAVTSWGLARVQDGPTTMVAGFADVRVQLALRETGAVIWQHDEDVTHPGRLPLQSLNGDRALVREQLNEVLERAGRRLASELVYWRNAP